MPKTIPNPMVCTYGVPAMHEICFPPELHKKFRCNLCGKDLPMHSTTSAKLIRHCKGDQHLLALRLKQEAGLQALSDLDESEAIVACQSPMDSDPIPCVGYMPSADPKKAGISPIKRFESSCRLALGHGCIFRGVVASVSEDNIFAVKSHRCSGFRKPGDLVCAECLAAVKDWKVVRAPTQMA